MRDKKIISTLCAALIALTVVSGELPRLISGSAFISAEESPVIGESGGEKENKSTKRFAYAENPFAGGDGSVENPYQISTAEQLNAIRNDLSANYVLISDIDLNIYDNWIPIGIGYEYTSGLPGKPDLEDTMQAPFTGNFNGNNFTIHNLKINSKDYDSVGLFGLSCGKISNIKLSNIQVKVNRKNIEYDKIWDKYRYPYLCVGGVVGYQYDSVIENCTITSGAIEVNDCYSAMVGGISGRGCVVKSENNANINVISDKSGQLKNDSTLYVGGITGEAPDTIYNCINRGDIIATAGNYIHCGGISGEGGKISFCINYGNIEGKILNPIGFSGGWDHVNVGGIVGGTYRNGNNHLINYGNVKGISLSDEPNSNASCSVGGLIGFLGGSIEDSYNISDSISSLSFNNHCRCSLGRICGYGNSLRSNFSVDTTFLNGEIPTENIGLDKINGEGVTKEKIEKIVNNIINGVDIDFHDLTAVYNDQAQADINNISMYKGGKGLRFKIPSFLKLNDEKIYHGEILLRDYNTDEVVLNIARDIDTDTSFWCLNGESEIEVCISTINDTSFHLRPNTSYYFDLSEVLINGQPYPDNEETKKQYCFTTGWGVVFGEQTFNFTNENDDFIGVNEENKYYISKEALSVLSKTSLPRFNSVIKYVSEQEWNGSCWGMSAVMMLVNKGMFNADNSIGSYDIPKKSIISPTINIPGGSRDDINFFHIIQDWYQWDTISSEKDKMLEILNKAKSIDSIDDIFLMRYTEEGQETGHAVVVIGGKEGVSTETELYIYDPNYTFPLTDKIVIQNDEVYRNNVKITKIQFFTSEEIRNFEISSHTKIRSKHYMDIKNRIQQLKPGAIYYLANGENSSSMAIILPPENYYEISSPDGILDYDVVNDDMFFAVKSDHAEKTIVSAEEGVKLINASGNYELTVSAEKMPYNMFDISGTANGDVICEYTDNGVEINLNHTADTVVTFYHDLETENYTVPAEYDHFVVGELKSKEAIFVDTNNDGIFDTDILGKTDDIHTHTFPDEWKSDGTSHWHECSCGEKSGLAAHMAGEWIVNSAAGYRHRDCTVCGAVLETASLSGGAPSGSRPVTNPSAPTETTDTENTDKESDSDDPKDEEPEKPEPDETDEEGDVDADTDENAGDDDEEDGEDNEPEDDGYDDTFSKDDTDGNDAEESSPIVTPEEIVRDENPGTGVPANAAMIFGFLISGAAFTAFSKRRGR